MNLHWIACAALALTQAAMAREAPPLSNPAIDMDGYLSMANQAAAHRESRRLSEADFKRMSAEAGTIVLDARSPEKFELLHVAGAINLSFPDITVASLEALMPDRNVRILIYCNNNFVNDERAFPRKLKTASLNLSTYIALYTYGYRNVYELRPLIDAANTSLKLVSGSDPRGSVDASEASGLQSADLQLANRQAGREPD